MVNDSINNKITLHIAANGCDGWTGSASQPDLLCMDGPLASIEGARNRIRSIRRSGKLYCPVEVLIHKGLYQIKETIHFTSEDLGDKLTPVVYRSAGDGEVLLTGGLRLDRFKQSRDAILEMDLKTTGYNGNGFDQLIHNGVRQTKARYPDYDPENPYGGGWLYVDGPIVDMNEDGHGKKDRFICKDPRLKTWSNVEEIELFIFPRFNWTNEILRLKSYDIETGEVVLQTPSMFEIYPGDRFYFRNVREELDAPGEWYYDKERSVLSYYPAIPVDESSVITVPLVENLIEINGIPKPPENLYIEKIDWKDSGGEIRHTDKLRKRNSGFISFQGFTLEGCEGAAIVIRNASGCKIVGCTIRNTGGAGIVVLESENCSVMDNDIYETGSHGIYVSGGARSPFNGVYESSCNEAVNNYIHHIGITYKSVAGIAINGTGIKAAHNYIHDGPRWGILSRGNNNLIEYNHIRHMNIETSDTAAIYLVDRDFSMRGTIIRYNRIHDILGYHCVDGVWHSPAFAFGIYLDDWTSCVKVFGNITYRTPAGGMYIHAGQDNLIENNMFLETKAEMLFLRRWEEAKEYRQMGTHGIGLRRNMIKRNIFASDNKNSCVYKIDNCNDAEGNPDIKGNVFEGNLIWCFGLQPVIQITNINHGGYVREISFDQWRDMGFDESSSVGDPLFADYINEDFTLEESSPAFRNGFGHIPIKEIGLYDSEIRASWPIKEADGAREHPLV